LYDISKTTIMRRPKGNKEITNKQTNKNSKDKTNKHQLILPHVQTVWLASADGAQSRRSVFSYYKTAGVRSRAAEGRVGAGLIVYET